MEKLVKVFKALSDETRLNILLLVSKRSVCQKGISKYLGISDSAVSQHIKVLKEANIINGYKKGYYVLYHIKMDPIWWTREKACLSIWDLFLYNIN